jgi:hypothetical protein
VLVPAAELFGGAPLQPVGAKKLQKLRVGHSIMNEHKRFRKEILS